MQKNDVILVDYTGFDGVNGQVFESTLASKAREGGVFNPNVVYKPVPIVLGLQELGPALETHLQSMTVGETKRVKLQANEAFGERSAEKIRILALRDFTQNKMNPIPGLIIDANGVQGKVQSVSGGRVRVDFNHPLAGKPIEYELVIRKQLTEKTEQVQAIFEKYFPGIEKKDRKISVEEDIVAIELPSDMAARPETQVLQKLFEKVLTEYLGFKSVEFAKPTPEETEKDSKTAPTAQLVHGHDHSDPAHTH